MLLAAFIGCFVLKDLWEGEILFAFLHSIAMVVVPIALWPPKARHS
jgi:hypothetical protein